jgi:hypothetical protein
MRSETCDYTGRQTYVPETIEERMAWALCMHDSLQTGGYLQEDELEGLEVMLRAMTQRCGSRKAEAEFLGIPIASVERYITPLKSLASLERRRRDEPKDAMLAMHLTAAYWMDYLPEAAAALSIALQDSNVAQALATPSAPSTKDGERT